MQVLTAYNPGFLQVPYLFVIRLPLGKNSVSLIWTHGTEHGEVRKKSRGRGRHNEFRFFLYLKEFMKGTNVDQGQN